MWRWLPQLARRSIAVKSALHRPHGLSGFICDLLDGSLGGHAAAFDQAIDEFAQNKPIDNYIRFGLAMPLISWSYRDFDRYVGSKLPR